MRARAAVLATLLLVPALLVGGCSSGSSAAQPSLTPIADEAPTEIMLDAIAALNDATSYHYTSAGLDVEVEGANVAATVNGVQVLRVGDDLWVKAPASYWAANLPVDVQDALLPKLADTFAKAAPHDTSFDSLVPNIFALLTIAGGVAKGDPTTVGDAAAIVVTGDGKQLFVATTGTPYPLRLVDGSTAYDFDGFDRAATIAAPADDQVFDLGSLGGCSSRTRFACVPAEGELEL